MILGRYSKLSYQIATAKTSSGIAKRGAEAFVRALEKFSAAQARMALGFVCTRQATPLE